MGVWHILGTALVAPIRRLDLVWKFFWPVIVFGAVVYMVAAAVGFSISNNPFDSLLTGHLSRDATFKIVGIWFFHLCSMPVILAFTAIGLIKWHRFYTIAGAPHEAPKLADDHRGRGWRLFYQWFLVGGGLCVWLIAINFLIAPFLSTLILPPNETRIEDFSPISTKLLSLTAFGLGTFAMASVAFASIFKRRSIGLAFVASDSLPGRALPSLDRYVSVMPYLVMPMALSLILPFAVVVAFYLMIEYITFLAGIDIATRLMEMVKTGERVDFGAPEYILLSITQSLVSAVYYFYPMLVFATFVSIYYREHVREQLLASLEEKAGSAPA